VLPEIYSIAVRPGSFIIHKHDQCDRGWALSCEEVANDRPRYDVISEEADACRLNRFGERDNDVAALRGKLGERRY